MYEYLTGKVISCEASLAIIEVQGIGYRLLVPQNLQLQPGVDSFFYTAFVVKEDAHLIYGFTEKQERDLFEKLIEISGIGPKTALMLIGHVPLTAFVHAIKTHHIPTFIHVPGIGKKTAERLIFELQAKLDTGWLATLEKESGSTLSSPKINDALSALLNLGFSPQSARSAIDKALLELPPEYELSALIAQALKSRRL